MDRPRTIICDIDGVLFRHFGDITSQHRQEPELLPGALEKIREWDIECCTIVLLTGRRESTRFETEEQLSRHGIIYDYLIMGVSSGVRVLINDMKPDGTENTAVAVSLVRNKGFDG